MAGELEHELDLVVAARDKPEPWCLAEDRAIEQDLGASWGAVDRDLDRGGLRLLQGSGGGCVVATPGFERLDRIRRARQARARERRR
jgi:hypothetical protein